MINIFQPSLGAEELEAIKAVFASNWLGKGKLADRFETEFAGRIGAPREQVRSVSCCTEGLFQSMSLLGIGPGDEVILPTISFVGAGNAVAGSGAKTVFCDVDLRTLNATAATIEACITPETKAILLIHYGGLPCEMDPILALASKHGIPVIEDSACSVASRYRGRACGTLGRIGVWSFDAMKILVTGDGGMVYCDTAEMALRFERLCYLGLESASGLASSVDKKWWEFEISTYGRRAIINDIAAAMGLEQLKKLAGFIARRRQIHEHYCRELANVDWLKLPPAIPADVESSYYLFWIQMDEGLRDRLAQYLRERGVYTTFRYYPLHWVEHYRAKVRLPSAEAAARATLCLPQHQGLTDQDLETVTKAIKDFDARAVSS